MDTLRDVALPCSSGTYRLTMHATPRTDRRGQTIIGYTLTSPTGVVLFDGSDFAGSPMNADDSDETVRCLVGFLTMRPGDTDPEYFDNYTDEQRAFCDSDAEELSLFAIEADSDYPAEPLTDWTDSEN